MTWLGGNDVMFRLFEFIFCLRQMLLRNVRLPECGRAGPASCLLGSGAVEGETFSFLPHPLPSMVVEKAGPGVTRAGDLATSLIGYILGTAGPESFLGIRVELAC